jgi:hypothetical protein
MTTPHEITHPTTKELLGDAFRLAFFRRLPDNRARASWNQLMAVAGVSLLIPIAFALTTVGGEGKLEWINLPGALFHLPLMLAASVLLASLVRGTRVSQFLLASLLAWCVIDLVMLAATGLVHDALPWQVTQYAPVAWLTLAVARYAMSLSPLPAPRAAWIVATCALVLALPMAGIYHERNLWSIDYERQADSKESYRAMTAAVSEEALYLQPELLERELEAIRPGRKGAVNLFFVGMAGYGRQDVVMREVVAVSTLFRERFQAEGHVVKLVNNPKTVLTTPMATTTSLKAAVNRIGAVMDTEKDVLVLFMTSHGSSGHEFSIDLWPLQFKQINPAMLREILDGSGIRNRVVVISACYAGGFIKQLEDENTLVIAAAAPDRNSFGCNNENNWTYFGKAYFDEALRETHSFTRAFEIAKPVIEARERREDFEPSHPQISMGTGIKVKLEALERQLEGR